MNQSRTPAQARRWRPAGFFLATAALALLPGIAEGQVKSRLPDPVGNQAFRNLLAQVGGVEPIARFEDFANHPAEETLLVVFGDLDCLDLLAATRHGNLQNFINAGGAALIASDRTEDDRLSSFGWRITGKLPRIPIVVEDTKDGNTALWFSSNPNATPIFIRRGQWEQRKVEFFRTEREQFDDCVVFLGHIGHGHPIFEGCENGIVLNKPSYMLPTRPQAHVTAIEVLSSFPPFRAPQEYTPPARVFPPEPAKQPKLLGPGDPVPKRFDLITEPAIAVGTPGDSNAPGRMLLIAGHGVFLNSSIGQQSLDNAHFTANVIAWLTAKKRKHCLFVDERGQIIKKFDVPLAALPLPNLRQVNQLLRNLEQENFFNRMLLDHVPRYRILRIALAIGLVGLTVYGFRRFARARHRQDFAVPLMEAKLAQVEEDYNPPLTRRQQHAFRANDFREAACVLARECLEAIEVQGEAHPRSPAEKRLQEVAYGDGTEPISAAEFGKIVTLAAEVRARAVK
jgi:hypothetical protein